MERTRFESHRVLFFQEAGKVPIKAFENQMVSECAKRKLPSIEG